MKNITISTIHIDAKATVVLMMNYLEIKESYRKKIDHGIYTQDLVDLQNAMDRANDQLDAANAVLGYEIKWNSWKAAARVARKWRKRNNFKPIPRSMEKGLYDILFNLTK